MRKRKALVGISLILFLVVLNVFLYAQPSMEELTGRTERLEKIIEELAKRSTEKDNIIGFFEEQQSSVYENANHAIRSVDTTVGVLSLVVIIVAGLIALGFPISFFIYAESLRKQVDKRFERIENTLSIITKAKNEAIEEIRKAKGASESKVGIDTQGNGHTENKKDD